MTSSEFNLCQSHSFYAFIINFNVYGKFTAKNWNCLVWWWSERKTRGGRNKQGCNNLKLERKSVKEAARNGEEIAVVADQEIWNSWGKNLSQSRLKRDEHWNTLWIQKDDQNLETSREQKR